MSGKLIGVDVGGTSARLGRFAGRDSDAIEQRTEFKVSGRYPEDLSRLTDAIRELASPEGPAGIALGIAGEHAPDKSRLLHSAHLPDWAGKPITEDVAKVFGCPVKLINDAEAAAWAEAAFGGHQKDFWFITWGTGIGGSIVERRPDGPQVVAAEPGHHVLRWDESSPVCDCGRRGCFEAYVGGAYFEQRFGKPAAKLSEADWNDITDWFARGLYNIVRVRPASRVVLGGGVTFKQSDRLPEIERKTNRHLKDVGTVKVSAAVHDENAGVVGAMVALRYTERSWKPRPS